MISVAARSVHDAAMPSPSFPSRPLTLAPCGVLSAAQEPRAPKLGRSAPGLGALVIGPSNPAAVRSGS